MTNLLKDPRTGDAQFVNSLGMSHTASMEYNIADFYAKSGDAYNFNTGTITLTSGSASGVAYIKNNEDHNLIISAYFYLLGSSTGGAATEDHLVQIIRNPTSVSFSTVQAPVNRNFGSFNTLAGDFFKGAEGATITGGTVAIESLFNSEGRKALNVGAVVIEKGNSCAIEITPKASNTSMDVQFAIAMYLDKQDLLGA